MLTARLNVFLFLSVGLALAHEGTPQAKAFRIENLECKGIACDLREGHQAGLTALEAHGDFRGVDSVRMRLLDRHRKLVVLDKQIETSSHGKVDITVPAKDLADGEYVLRIATADVPRLLAVGTFRKASGAAPPAAETPQAAAPPGSGDAKLAGSWMGIKNTGGVLVLTADGKYTINGGAGEYRVSGQNLTFTGPLSVWNGGKAALKGGVIEFAWTNPKGAKRSYAFARSR